EVRPAVDSGGDQSRGAPFHHVVETDVDRVGRSPVHRPALDLPVGTPRCQLLDAQRPVERDAAAGGALLAVRRADHHLAELEQRLRQRAEPRRLGPVVVAHQDAHGRQCGPARIGSQRLLAGGTTRPQTAAMSEARALASPLPPAPASLAGEGGTPRYGLYAGSLGDAAFKGLTGLPGPLQRRLVEKKW